MRSIDLQRPEIAESGGLEVAFEWRGESDLAEKAARVLQSDVEERKAAWLDRARAQVRGDRADGNEEVTQGHPLNYSGNRSAERAGGG